jgi:plastocyanin
MVSLRRVRGQVLLATCAALLAGAVVVAVAVAHSRPTATMEVIADDLEFRGPNPTLHGEPGARVRLTFRNASRGIIHELVINDLKVKTGVLQPGETAEVCFTLPQREGTYAYACSLHSLMKGELVVGERSEVAER